MDRQELGQRIVDWTPLLYHVACGLLSDESDREDAVQSAIEKAWRKADSLREPNKLKPWLVRILVNECHEVLRRRKREFPRRTCRRKAPRRRRSSASFESWS